jgi:hypothetical protein
LWLQWRYGRKLESDNLFFRHLSGIKATAAFRIVLPFLETGNAPPISIGFPDAKVSHCV